MLVTQQTGHRVEERGKSYEPMWSVCCGVTGAPYHGSASLSCVAIPTAPRSSRRWSSKRRHAGMVLRRTCWMPRSPTKQRLCTR